MTFHECGLLVSCMSELSEYHYWIACLAVILSTGINSGSTRVQRMGLWLVENRKKKGKIGSGQFWIGS